MSHKGSLYAIQHTFQKCVVCGKEFEVNAGLSNMVCSHSCSSALNYSKYFPFMKQMAYEYEWLGWGLRALSKKYGITTQHTFVQVNEDGTEVTRWSGSRDISDIASKVE